MVRGVSVRIRSVLDANSPATGTLVCGVLLVVALILLAATYLGGHLLTGARSYSDESLYVYFARNIVHGKYAVASQQTDGKYLWHGPGLPLVLAPFAALNLSVHVMRIVGPTSLVLAGIMMWRLLTRWVSPRLAVLGGALLSLFLPFLRLLPQLYSEPLELMFLVATILALTKAYESGQLRWAVVSGLCAGGVVLTRVDEGWVLIIFTVGVLLFAAWKRSRKQIPAVVCVVVACVVCAPWLAHTYSLAHQFPYWASSGGESLYWMASTTPGNTGSWTSTTQALTDPNFAPDRPLFERIAHLPQVERASRLQSAAVRLIRQYPLNFLKHVVENFTRMVFGAPYSFQSSAARLVAYGVPDVALLLLLGWAIFWLRRRFTRLPFSVKALLVVGAVSLVVHLPVSAYTRMNTPMIPGIIAVIALGADGWLRTPQPSAPIVRRSARP